MLRVGDAGQWRVQERDPLRGAIVAVSATSKPRLAPPKLLPVSVAGEPCCHRRRTLPLTHRSFWPLPELLPGWSGIAAASFSCFELFVLLRKRVGLCFEAAFGFGLKRKGLCDAFELWKFAF
ncbi:uncharacterized protein DS421_18g621310 [Arachis hypogaea]|nr:uncharacterized protein DS421_18g621310 [Arachis hypogaea]